MSIIIDLILVALLLVFIIWFTKLGFGRIIDKTGKAWISLFSMLAAGPLLSNFINDWFLSSGFTSAINNTLLGIIQNNPNGYNVHELFANLPQGFIGFLEHYNININELIATYGSSTAATDEIVWDMANKIAAPCASIVSTIIGHLVFYFAFYFFARWMYAVACNADNKLKKKAKEIMAEPNHQKQLEMLKKLRRGRDTRRLRTVRFLNRLLGFGIGIAVGGCIVIASSVLLLTIFQVIIAYDASSSVMSIYDNSRLFKFANESGAWSVIKHFLGGN